MGDIRVEMLTNQEPRFYSILGPYLSRREIVAELGFPVYDDPGKIWFVAMDNNQVAGFVGLRLRREKAIFCSDYVRPEYRGQHIYDRLMTERIAFVTGKALMAAAVVTKVGRHAYERHGFTVTRERRNYTDMSRSLS